MKGVLAAAALAIIAMSASGAQAPTAAASAIGGRVSIDRARIDRALRDMVSSGRAAGVSALVWKDGREVYFGTAGYADREAGKPMRNCAG